MDSYLPRLADGLLDTYLAAHPAVMLLGPRGCGKTTTGRRHARSFVRLDRRRDAGAFSADPDAALAAITEHPVLLDEWQDVPEILGAVKRSVDDTRGPGRFLLSGSVRAPLTTASWPGTGRVIELPMGPLTVRERLGRVTEPPFIRRLAQGRLPPAPVAAPDLVGYIDLALEGGFPETLGMEGDARRVWLRDYVNQLVGRDLQGAGYDLEPRKLRSYFRSYAANSAGVCDHATIYRAADINHRTAQRYEGLLEALFVVQRLEAWSVNPLQRLVHQPKRFVADCGIWAALLRIDRRKVLMNGDLIGRLLETFVHAQLRAELPLEPLSDLFHLRTHAGRQEIDLIGELDGGGIVGIEVKATSAPRKDDAKHLIWLRDELGEEFVRGAVLHTGPYTFELDDRILAVPICAIWA